ncbi:hypothetical protein [Methylobacterium sp. J-068]|uniref:hypothetical protein n=1 Tax=Methylobacterium sp. J-068 TaxID=2836649 RepID=UPI001FBBDC91|nr:hypothetical protein [Methylobacterium sp. J-068]MCJ2032928.1 hypothetical protein [Methylobacterium sp. J-068]
MTLLATLLWPFLALSLLLGTGIGWLAGLPRTRAARWGAIALAVAACVTCGLAASGTVGGRAGFWIEGSAMLLGAYLVGAALAAGVTHRAGSRP